MVKSGLHLLSSGVGQPSWQLQCHGCFCATGTVGWLLFAFCCLFVAGLLFFSCLLIIGCLCTCRAVSLSCGALFVADMCI